ncbi:hypothetical protein ACROYT_G008752 [Oculina patagonica]
MEIVNTVTEKKGLKKDLEALVPDQSGCSAAIYMKQFRVPDWVLLYFKLEAKLPDKADNDQSDEVEKQQQQQQFGPFMNELHSQLNVGEGSQSRPGSASSDITSSPTSPVAVASTSTASSPEFVESGDGFSELI